LRFTILVFLCHNFAHLLPHPATQLMTTPARSQNPVASTQIPNYG
jgi:hypothetical protein